MTPINRTWDTLIVSGDFEGVGEGVDVGEGFEIGLVFDRILIVREVERTKNRDKLLGVKVTVISILPALGIMPALTE
jgi:hypothetical protein